MIMYENFTKGPAGSEKHPSRIQGGEKHLIPDPQLWLSWHHDYLFVVQQHYLSPAKSIFILQLSDTFICTETIPGFRHMIFYDMGAQDTTATVVGYQIVKTKERGFAETHPQASYIFCTSRIIYIVQGTDI
jgi:hypothetical protein